MITPVIIADLDWKAYLIFMCTNFAFVPLVYFCYPETANFTLEEIDSLFTVPGKSATNVAKQLKKEGKVGLRSSDRISSLGNSHATTGDTGEKVTEVQHLESA